MKIQDYSELDQTILQMERVNARIKSHESTLALAIKRGVSNATRERMEERLDDLNDLFISLVNRSNRLQS
jgi:ppGpp synthetase/RelA/SpoT-type nucleotidyltranferase